MDGVTSARALVRESGCLVDRARWKQDKPADAGAVCRPRKKKRVGVVSSGFVGCWASVVRHPESESQKRIGRDTGQDPTPHLHVSYSSASCARPSATTSTDQGTGTSDASRASSEEHIDGDVTMGGDSADDDTVRHTQTAEGGSRRSGNHLKPELSNEAPLNGTFREGSSGRRLPKDMQLLSPPRRHWTCPVRKTMRIAHVENNALNWVSISSAGPLVMTHCHFSARAARDEMRHIIGSSEPDVIIGSDKDRNRGCRNKDKDHIEFLCELFEAQVARGRYFVHELTSEVNSGMRCVAKVMAMPE